VTSPSKTAPTRFVDANGTRFAYRRFGEPTGTPIVLLQHFMGNLDNYDPAITDALAMGREVILTDNAGVGLSTGTAPDTVAGMARDAASIFLSALTSPPGWPTMAAPPASASYSRDREIAA